MPQYFKKTSLISPSSTGQTSEPKDFNACWTSKDSFAFRWGIMELVIHWSMMEWYPIQTQMSPWFLQHHQVFHQFRFSYTSITYEIKRNIFMACMWRWQLLYKGKIMILYYYTEVKAWYNYQMTCVWYLHFPETGDVSL